MFFPESESLTKIFPRKEIESIDSYIASGVGKFLDDYKIAYFTDIEQAQVGNILAEYVQLGVISSETVLECAQCNNLYELTGPNSSFCDNCDMIIYGQKSLVKQVFKLNKEKLCVETSGFSKILMESQSLLISDLQNALRTKDVIFMVGAGASIAATMNQKNSSWKSLLATGIEWCQQLASPPPSASWIDIIKKEVESPEVDLFLSAAEKISVKLESVHELSRFFRESISTLEVKDSALLNSILSFKAPVMTTNYDDLFENSANLTSISWHQTNKVNDWIRNQREGILHVHGHWDDPTSKIIFGTTSYAHITTDQAFDTMLNVIRGSKNIVYLCFGSSLEDPHFAAFFKYGAEIFKNTNARHFKFCRDIDIPLSQIEKDNRIARIEYGRDYKDLAPFLKTLFDSIR